MSKEEASKYRSTASKLNYLSLDRKVPKYCSQAQIPFTCQSHGCFRLKRGFKVIEFTQTRRGGDQTTKNIEIPAEASDNNINDALMHHYTREEAKKHVKHMGMEFMSTSSEAVRRGVCANLGETRDVIEEEATCVSLL